MSTLRELHDLHEELLRLLTFRQAPAIALKLQLVFLRHARGLGPTAWAGYGFPVALSMAERIAPAALRRLDPADLDLIEEVLARASEAPALPLPGASRWPEVSARALRAARDARAELARFLETPSGSAGTGASACPHRSRGEASAAIRIPVVAEVIGAERSHRLFANLRAAEVLLLCVRAEAAYRRSPEPGLTVEGGMTADVRQAFRASLDQSRALRAPGAPEPRQCWFRAEWDDTPGAHLVGRSASLGFLLAAAAARGALSPGFWAREIPENLAVTGSLAGTKVVPVSAESLALKIRACFFSAIETFCVPWEQRADALAEARKLEREFPARQLVIRGVKDARDLWNDPSILTVRGRRPREVAALSLRRLAMSRAVLAVAVLIMLLSGGLAVYEANLSRNLPANAVWEGDVIVVTNHHGRVCRRIPAPFHSPLPIRAGDGIGFSLGVQDVDRDGVNEILAIHGSEPGNQDVMTAFDRSGRLLWQRRAADLGPAGIPPRADLRWFFIYPCGYAEHPTEIFVLRRSRQHGLSLLDRLDSATGKILGQLWNDGHLEAVSELDLDRDGTREWALMGTDNTERSGVLLVLDPRRMRTAPQASEIDSLPHALDPHALNAGIRVALAFPKDRFTTDERPHCVQISFEENGLAKVDVRLTEGTIIFFLRWDRSLLPRVEHAQITDAYKSALRLRLGDRVTARQLAAEEKRLGSGVRRLTPAGWIAVDTVAAVPGSDPVDTGQTTLGQVATTGDQAFSEVHARGD